MRFSLLLIALFCAGTSAQPPRPKPKSELPTGGKIETSQPAMEVDENGFPVVKSKKPKKSSTRSDPAESIDVDAANLPVNENGEARTYGPNLDPIVKRLRKGKASERYKAAAELGALGSTAAAAARPLCDAVGEPNEGVARAALAALETVRPDLHKHIAPMMLDGNVIQRGGGAYGLKAMGPAARPATGLLLNRLTFCERTKAISGNYDEYPDSYYDAVSVVALGDPQAVAFFKTWSKSTHVGNRERSMGIHYLVSWAGLDSEHRKEIVKLVMGRHRR